MTEVDTVAPAKLEVAMVPRPGSHKIAVGTVGGAGTIMIVWALRYFLGIDMPAEVSQAMTILISTGVSLMVPDEMEA